MFRRLAFTALSVVALRAAVSPNSSYVVKLVENRYNSAQTLKVNFTEDYSIQGHPRPPESGTLTLRKQGKMRWEYARPAGKLFVSDGKKIYLYTAQDNRVEEVPLKDTADLRAPLAFLLGHLDINKEFSAIHTQAESGGFLLTASAKNGQLAYQSIEMQVKTDGSITGLKIMGRDGSLLQYRFSDEKLNPVVPDQAFHFVIPPGAAVLNALDYKEQGK